MKKARLLLALLLLSLSTSACALSLTAPDCNEFGADPCPVDPGGNH